MKKICFVVADLTFKGGIERVTCNLANDFSENYEVKIISFFNTNKEINFFLNPKVSVQYLTDEKYDGKPGSLKRMFKFFGIFLQINKLLKNMECDYIIGQGMPVSLMMFPLNFFNKRIIACEHVYYNYYKSLIRNIRDILYKYYYKVVVLTENDRKKFQRKLKNVECIENYISKISLKKSSLDNQTLITVGRLENQKGYDMLINICSLFIKKYPEWKLKIFGEGNLEDQLKKMVEKKGLTNQILFMGVTDKINKEYEKADVYIMSSRYEGMPMVLLEAMSYGLPIVSFDCPSGPSDIIEDNESGFLIKDFDQSKMKEKIELLINNEVLRKEMGKKAKIRVEKFSKYNILNKWNKILGE